MVSLPAGNVAKLGRIKLLFAAPRTGFEPNGCDSPTRIGIVNGSVWLPADNEAVFSRIEPLFAVPLAGVEPDSPTGIRVVNSSLGLPAGNVAGFGRTKPLFLAGCAPDSCGDPVGIMTVNDLGCESVTRTIMGGAAEAWGRDGSCGKAGEWAKELATAGVEVTGRVTGTPLRRMLAGFTCSGV